MPTKISGYTELAEAPAAGDLFVIVDVSATPPSSGTTKKVTAANVAAGVAASSAVTTLLASKADASTVASLSTAVSGKADASALATLAGVVTTKADAAAMAALPRPLVMLGRWNTSESSAAATGYMGLGTTVPLGCTPIEVTVRAATNPSGGTGGATVQVEVAGSNLLTAAATLADGSTAALVVETGFALPSLAKGASVRPTLASVGAAVRGLVVEVWGRES